MSFNGVPVHVPGLGDYHLKFTWGAFKCLKELTDMAASDVIMALGGSYDPVLAGYVLVAAATPEITIDDLDKLKLTSNLWIALQPVFLGALRGASFSDEDLTALGQAVKQAEEVDNEQLGEEIRARTQAIQMILSKQRGDSESDSSPSQPESSLPSPPENTSSGSTDTSKGDDSQTTDARYKSQRPFTPSAGAKTTTDTT